MVVARVLAATALGVGGLLGAFTLVAAPGAALVAGACGALAGPLTSRWVRTTATGDTASAARAGRRAGLLVGAGVTGGGLALTGLLLLMGPASDPALLLLVIAFSVWWWRRRSTGGLLRAAQDRLLRAAERPDSPRQVPAPRRATPPSAPVPPAPVPPAPVLRSVPTPGDLSTPQLCAAWQRTYFALLDLPTGAPRGEVVALRARLLDEIERRDPDGFTRWLDTGARAGSDPGRYLAGDR